MISELRLQHFRSYDDVTFQFNAGVNIIVGPNAAGKTNLLEAVLVVARGNSYRVKEQELIAFDQPWTRIDAKTDKGGRTVKITTTSKAYEINEKYYKRLPLTQTLPIVLFEPNHLSLLTGSPDQRRGYLDEILEQTSPGYSSNLKNYRRVLTQRNALLKRVKKPNNEELFPWNIRLSELGAALARARSVVSEHINNSLQSKYQILSHTTTELALRYHTLFPITTYETALLQKLEHNVSIDSQRGFTSAGPHREDFVVYFGEHVAQETASRGELRTAVLALKIIELQLIEAAREQSPLLLLDDVFSELDESRRSALTQHLFGHQTFITTTDADATQKSLSGLLIRVKE